MKADSHASAPQYSIPDPRRILLIGNGRLARHLFEYFKMLNLVPQTWSRNRNSEVELETQLAEARTVLLAISDRSLMDFFERNHHLAPGADWVHFSGALEIPGLHSFHPLMTFASDLYDFKTYQEIPFITTGTAPLLDVVGLKNPCYRIPSEKKARYHALCVLSGNFTTLLWQKIIGELQAWNLPQNVGQPYARQTIENVFQDPTHALTGPLVRHDLVTQEKNLAALQGDPYADIYRAFQTVFERTEKEEKI